MRETISSPTRRWLWPAVAATVATALLAGCTGGTSSTATDPAAQQPRESTAQVNGLGGAYAGPKDDPNPRTGGKIVMGLEAEPEGLDPTRYAFSAAGHLVASAVFDPLITLDANGQPVPYLASSITPTDNYQTWTLEIPTGVTFHDDTPLTAKIVADDLNSYAHSGISSEAFVFVASIEAPDDTHVVVKMKQPNTAFAAALATQHGYIFSPKMNDDTSLVDRPIGTGPFIIENHVKDRSWTLKRNPHYWRKGLPRLDSIEFRPIPEDAQRLQQLRSGDIDMMDTLRPQQILQLREADFKRVENSGGDEDHILLNTDADPFNSLTARQAVAYATDAATWRAQTMLGVEQPANSPFAPGQLGYLDDNGYPQYNLDKAKELVKQYEAENPGKKLSFEWLTQADSPNQGESQFFSDAYKAAGMDVTIRGLPQIQLVAQIATGNYQMGRFRLFNEPDPDVDAISFWLSTAVVDKNLISLNFPRFKNPEVDQAIRTAISTTDANVKNEQFQKVNRIFAEQLPYLWLGRSVWVLAANKKVNGIYAAVNGTLQTIGPKTWISELWVSG